MGKVMLLRQIFQDLRRRWRNYEESLPCPHGTDVVGDSIIWYSLEFGCPYGRCEDCGKVFGTEKERT